MGFDYSVSSSPFLRFSMRFEFLAEMFDNSVCEIMDLSLTIYDLPSHHARKDVDIKCILPNMIILFCIEIP